MEPEVDGAGVGRRTIARRLALGAVAATGIYAAFALYLDLGKLTQNVQRVSPSAVFVALGFATLSFVVRFGRWQYFLAELDIRPSLIESALIFTSGLGMSITPGKAGELVKAVMLKGVTGARTSSTVPIVVAERVGDLLALILLAAFGLSASPWGLTAAALSVLLVASAAALLSSRRLAMRVIDLVTVLPRTRALRERLVTAWSSLSVMFAPKRLLIGLVFGCSAWLLHCAAFATIARDLLAGSFSFRASVLANTAPLLLGAAAMIPGGLGIAEVSMAGVIVALGGQAVDADAAGAVTLVVRLTTLWWAVALGVSALIAWQIRGARRPALDRAESSL